MPDRNIGIVLAAAAAIAIIAVAGAIIFLLPPLPDAEPSAKTPGSGQNAGGLPEPKTISLPAANIFSDLQAVNEPVTLSGNIQDLENGVVEGVAVTLNTGEQATSDAKGNYSIKAQYAGETIVTFSKDGYVPVHKTVYLGRDEQVNALLQKSTEPQSIDLSVEINVSQDGAGLKAGANSFVVKGTGKAAETAYVSLTAFDPTNDEERSVFPGEFEGLSTGGESVGLESFGFAKISVTDDSGKTLDLAEGETAVLTVPIPESEPNAPETIPLWYFDPKRETWVEAGTGVKRCESGKCFYDGKINTIASWWNCDMPSITSSIGGMAKLGGKFGGIFGPSLMELYEMFLKEKAEAGGEYLIEDEKARAYLDAIRKLEQMHPELSATEIANAVNFIVQNPWDYETGFFAEVKIGEEEILAAGFLRQVEFREGGEIHSNKEDYVSRELDLDFTHITGVPAAMQEREGSGIIDRSMGYMKSVAYSHGGDAVQLILGYATGAYEGIKTMTWPERDFARARATYSSDQYNADSLAMKLRKVILAKDNKEKLSDLFEFSIWMRERELKGDFSPRDSAAEVYDGTALFQEAPGTAICSKSGICLDGNFMELENTADSFMLLRKSGGNTYNIIFLVGTEAEKAVDFEASPQKNIEAELLGSTTTGALAESAGQSLFTAKAQGTDGKAIRVLIYSEHAITAQAVNSLLSDAYYSPETTPNTTRDELLAERMADTGTELKAKLKARGLDYTGYSSTDITFRGDTAQFSVPVRENSRIELVAAFQNYESFPVEVKSGPQGRVTDLGTITFEFAMESCVNAEFPAQCMLDYSKMFEGTAMIAKAKIDNVLAGVSDARKRARAYMYFALFYSDATFCENLKGGYYYNQCIGELSAKTGNLDTCLKLLDGTDFMQGFNTYSCIKDIDPQKQLAYDELVSAITQKPGGPNERLFTLLAAYYENDAFCENLPYDTMAAPGCFKDTGIELKSIDTCLRSLETTHSVRQWYTGWCLEKMDPEKGNTYEMLTEKLLQKPEPFNDVLSRLGGYYGNTRFCELIDPSNGSAPECYRDAGITAKDTSICLRSLETRHMNSIWYASWCIRDVDKAKQLGYDALIGKITAKQGNKDRLLIDLADFYSDKRFCPHIENKTSLDYTRECK